MTVKDVTEEAAAAVVSDELVKAVVSDALEGGVELLGPDGVLAEIVQAGAGTGPSRGDDRSFGLRTRRPDRPWNGQQPQRIHSQEGADRDRRGGSGRAP